MKQIEWTYPVPEGLGVVPSYGYVVIDDPKSAFPAYFITETGRKCTVDLETERQVRRELDNAFV